MKFVRVFDGEKNILGVMSKDDMSIMPLSQFDFFEICESMIDFIKQCDDDKAKMLMNIVNEDKETLVKIPKDFVKFLAPIEKPIHDVICVGVNYMEHREECNEKMGEVSYPATVYFSKRCKEFVGPFDSIDGNLDIDEKLDYEVELAVVIGKECKNVTLENAEDVIFGYTVFNDVSARKLQKAHSQWFRGKSLDGFSVLGPCIVHKFSLPMPLELNLESKLNGEIRQSSNTSLMIKNVSEIIEEFSTGCTLEAGDIIATGTPSGVGMGFTPGKYMKKDDVIECYVEGIGTLKNHID